MRIWKITRSTSSETGGVVWVASHVAVPIHGEPITSAGIIQVRDVAEVGFTWMEHAPRVERMMRDEVGISSFRSEPIVSETQGLLLHGLLPQVIDLFLRKLHLVLFCHVGPDNRVPLLVAQPIFVKIFILPLDWETARVDIFHVDAVFWISTSEMSVCAINIGSQLLRLWTVFESESVVIRLIFYRM